MPVFLFLLLLFLIQPWAPVRAEGVALVSGEDGPLVQEFARELRSGLQGSKWQLAQTVPPAALPPDTRLIVTLGAESLQRVLAAYPGKPVLAAMVPRTAFLEMAGKRPETAGLSAIYLDQPVERQLAFLRILLPKVRRPGLIHSERSRATAMEFLRAGERHGLRPFVASIQAEGQLLERLEQVLPETDVLLAIPDALVYSRTSIRPFLISSLRYQRPVIGFSPAFVKAGALGALHATPGEIGQQAARLIRQHGTQIPTHNFPSTFQVSINQSIAAAYGLPPQDEAAIHRKLVQEEGKP